MARSVNFFHYVISSLHTTGLAAICKKEMYCSQLQITFRRRNASFLLSRNFPFHQIFFYFRSLPLTWIPISRHAKMFVYYWVTFFTRIECSEMNKDVSLRFRTLGHHDQEHDMGKPHKYSLLYSHSAYLLIDINMGGVGLWGHGLSLFITLYLHSKNFNFLFLERHVCSLSYKLGVHFQFQYRNLFLFSQLMNMKYIFVKRFLLFFYCRGALFDYYIV